MSEERKHEELGRMFGQLAHRRLSRRNMLGVSARAGVGAAGLALVGCGDDDDSGAPVAAPDGATDRPRRSPPWRRAWRSSKARSLRQCRSS